jgi:2-iminoacetate synthase
MNNTIINASQINNILQQYREADKNHVRDILKKSLELKGLTIDEVAVLTSIEDETLILELFTAADKVKTAIYGNRIVLFAPLYISNLCTNDCLYCAFRVTNHNIVRRSLSQEEIAAEVTHLINQGQKRLLLVAGESYTRDGFQYILDSLDTIYKVKNKHGEIRRANVNIAPLTTEDFKRLKEAKIGTYQLFQETYHPETYQKMHVAGKKADYNWRIEAIDRAMEMGIDDVGIGVLFGLTDWRFEVLALMQHVQHLNTKFGIGPHTVSIPRLEPASGSDVSSNPPFPVNDNDFLKIIAILRLAIPSTGIILSTRENPKIRRDALNLGISQISAGSRTNPGGYTEEQESGSQFSLGDHRDLDEVVGDVASLGYIPSFCTACYRSKRTGESFMTLAKSGKIKDLCSPNALITFAEYLADYASPKTLKIGRNLIIKELSALSDQQRKIVLSMLDKIKNGARDVFV